MLLSRRLGFLATPFLFVPVLASGSSIFADVPADAWYAENVDALLADGYLDASSGTFRPEHPATRAEVVKLVVALNGGVLSAAPERPSFDDVPRTAWHFTFMEEAAKEDWVRGEGNCKGSHPCFARPDGPISRAEVAALVVRSYALEPTGSGPSFADNPAGQWYTDVIKTAADHCVLAGDKGSGTVRPQDPVNRAEMAAILHRVDASMRGDAPACEGAAPIESVLQLDSVIATSVKTLEVRFTGRLDAATALDPLHYVVSGGTASRVASVMRVDDVRVELTLAGTLGACGEGERRTLQVTGLRDEDGEEFSDALTFPYPCTALDLSASAAAVHPLASGSGEHGIRRNDSDVLMLSVDVTASCTEDMKLTSVLVHHEGVGSALDITGVHAGVDGKIIGEGAYGWREGSWKFDFATPVDVAVCKTTTIDFTADFSSKAQPRADHGLAIRTASGFALAGERILGTFPLRGPVFRVY